MEALDILKTICRASLVSDNSILHQLPVESIDWDAVWDAAEKEDTTYWCLDFVTSHPEFISPERLSAWRMDYYSRIASNQAVLIQLDQMVSACRSEGIEIIALKGSSLLLWLYDDPGARQLGDIDILVKEEQALDAVKVFRKMGYEIDHGHTFVTSPEVLIHICLLEGGHIPPLYKPLSYLIEMHLDFLRGHGDWEQAKDEVWENAASINHGVNPINCLHPRHALINAAVHYSKHIIVENPQYRWLFDIAVMVNKHGLLDWEQVWKTADRWGVTDDLCTALEAVENDFGLHVDLPAERKLVRTLAKVPSALQKIRCLPTLSMKISYLRDVVIPHPEYMRKTFDLPNNARLSLVKAYLRLFRHRFMSICGKRDYM